MKQRTLGGSFSLKSKGLHTGLDLTVTMKPAPADHGYFICRTDLEGQPVVRCLAENVTETTRGTVVNAGGVKCSTIEHGMAALMAAGIDNEPSDRFEVNATIKFPGQVLGESSAEITDMSLFPKEMAAARTFVFVREIAPLLEMGLIKGGDLDNAVVIYEIELPQEKLDALCQHVGAEKRDATKLGYIQHRPLQWDNECARHKALDIIGDMALVGRPIQGKITAYKPGHTINNVLARKLRTL